MDDTELHRERILRHVNPIITGRFVGYQASYTREIRIGRPLALFVFVSAGIAQIIAAVLRMRPVRRTLKELRKGPEFLVTPVRLRDDLGQTYEIEMHGQLPQSALHRGDLVQVRTQPQADHTLPVKLLQVVNLTTMQPLTPRIPTQWSHLGPALLLQAGLGVTILGAVLAAWLR
jgi:hypothetical protein